MECYFILGKGGVGKSTISILKALAFVQNEKRVTLISLDQAHNLFDIIGQTKNQLPKTLRIFEPDIEQFIKKYLQQSEQLLQKNYRYLTSLNLEHHFKVLKQTPGLEEYGLLLAFQYFFNKGEAKADVLIFDMPPTAVALKFFSLPFVSVVWLEQLLKLRNEILEKKEIISKVKFGRKKIETDAIKKNLEQQLIRYQQLADLFRNRKNCKIVLVANPDSISLAESQRIGKQLTDLNIPVSQFYLNKNKALKQPVADFSLISGAELRKLPESDKTLIGLPELMDFSRENFSDLI